jgi:ABC-type transporter Mla subunit MlaD
MPRLSIVPVALAVLLAACAEKHEHVVHVIAEQAHGLKKSARVQYRGTEVGLVKQVYFTPGGVRIDLLIERDDVPIRTQDTVRIAQVGAFGEQVVEIIPGVQTAPLIANDATLPAVKPDTTVSIPVGVWRSIVKTLGFADTSVVDSAAVRKAADSAAAKRP